MKNFFLFKLLLSAIFVSIIFVACEQQVIVNTPTDTLENIEVSGENNTLYEMTPEEEQLLYESLTSNEGNSEEDTDITLRVDPDDYSTGPSWINNFVVYKSKDGDCSGYPDVEQWFYYRCPSNRDINGEHFKFDISEYIVAGSSSDAYYDEVSKEVSAGKPANDQNDSECYRTTTYSHTTSGGNDYVYRLRYRRSGQNYSQANWTSWRKQSEGCRTNTSTPNCY